MMVCTLDSSKENMRGLQRGKWLATQIHTLLPVAVSSGDLLS